MSEISIDPEAINRYVAEQIAKSAIGEALRKAIDEELKKFTSVSYMSSQNPIRTVVSVELNRICREVLEQPEYQQQIKDEIVKLITPDFISKLAENITIKGGW